MSFTLPPQTYFVLQSFFQYVERLSILIIAVEFPNDKQWNDLLLRQGVSLKNSVSILFWIETHNSSDQNTIYMGT